MSPHLSTLTLHRLRYDELHGDELRQAQAHLEACESCRGRLGAQQAFRRAFEAAPPRLALPAEPPPRTLGQRLRALDLRWLWAPALALAVAALLVLPGRLPLGGGGGGLVEEGRGGLVEGGPEDEGRVKGAAGVLILVEERGVLGEGEAVHPGDRLQLRLPPGSGSEAWVGDRDGPIGRFALSPDGPTLSPFALTVDAEEGDEELILVLSAEPLDRQAAGQAMKGRAIEGVRVQRIRLRKAR